VGGQGEKNFHFSRPGQSVYATLPICYSRKEMEPALTARIKESSGEKTPPALKVRLDEIQDEF